jgi:hypothetical protein
MPATGDKLPLPRRFQTRFDDAYVEDGLLSSMVERDMGHMIKLVGSDNGGEQQPMNLRSTLQYRS